MLWHGPLRGSRVLKKAVIEALYKFTALHDLVADDKLASFLPGLLEGPPQPPIAIGP